MGNMSGSYGSHYTLRLDAYVLSQDYSNNRSTIRADLYLDFDGSSYWSSTNYTTYGSITINGNTSNKSISSISYSSGQAKSVYLGTHDVVVNHNNDGTCNSISVSGSWNTDTSRIGSGSTSTSVKPANIPRYANITSFSVNKRDTSSVTFNWSTDAACDWAWYSIDNGGSWNNLPPNNIITGLSAGTGYNFKLKVRRTDSQLITESSTVYQTTYPNTEASIWPSSIFVDVIAVASDANVPVSSTLYRIKVAGGSYGEWQSNNIFYNLAYNTTYTIQVQKISSEGNIYGYAETNATTLNINTLASATFDFGNPIYIKIFSPSNSTSDFYIDVDGERVKTIHSMSAGEHTINLADYEWDIIYKHLDSQPKVVNLGVRTGSTNYYYDSSYSCYFYGNQPTTHININGTWKRAKRWINVNGNWYRAVRWINVNGTWKKCI